MIPEGHKLMPIVATLRIAATVPNRTGTTRYLISKITVLPIIRVVGPVGRLIGVLMNRMPATLGLLGLLVWRRRRGR